MGKQFFGKMVFSQTFLGKSNRWQGLQALSGWGVGLALLLGLAPMAIAQMFLTPPEPTELTEPDLHQEVEAAFQLDGAGATFPERLYQRYFEEFFSEQNIQVNYYGIGSPGGVRQILAGTVDFAGTEMPLTEAQLNQIPGGALMIPMAGGAIAIVYNLPGVESLRLSREVYPAIFAGDITQWNDARIAADNPGVTLPDLPIIRTVRGEPSGTTFLFTNHLSTISPSFQSLIGISDAPLWSGQVLRGRRNSGIALEVNRQEGAIGYIDLTDAEENELAIASLENRQGEFVMPSVTTAQQAFDSLLHHDLGETLSDPIEGYPLLVLTWIIAYRRYYDAETAQQVQQLLEWMLTDGQDEHDSLGYLSLSSDVRSRFLTQVQTEIGVHDFP